MRGLKRIVFATLMAVALAAALAAPAAAAAKVDGRLVQRVQAAPLGATPVVITYGHRPNTSDLGQLRALGLTGGVVLDPLPMVLTAINQAQLDALRSTPGVVSLWANHRFPLLTNKARSFIGVSNLLADAEVSARLGGLPVSGRDVGVAYVDTGIDATHPDLQLGRNVAQNVFFPLAEYSATEMPLPTDFVPIVAVENAPLSDVEGGHGTFGAAVTAGTGDASGGFYGGVAPGAKLVGLVAGNDVGLTTFAILQAYGYALANQFRYNIRVCNNSWGTVLRDYAYDPLDPINTATRELHDRNIVVVFAAGNGIDSVGDVPGAINPFSTAPWVISVGAGEKQGLGTPATFSSRGEDDGTGTDTAGQPADPLALPNLRPDLIGSGVDVKSARSKAPGVTNIAGTLPIFVGANDLTTIPPAFLPFYTTSQGTSFSTPQVSGVVALMLEANPALTPDEVVAILRQTANPMPYGERVVGAGYVDAHNAVRRAMALGAVDHPTDLFPRGPQPAIVDAPDDQLGTTAQDIRTGDFAYDAAARQIVYTLTLADLSNRTANNRWTMSSKFGETTVFVTAAVTETGAMTFTYGRITILASGTRNQQNLGPTDAGQVQGNVITIRLSLDKVNAAVGFDALFTTSTATEALAQILLGTSATGGLLLNADRATGSDFKVGEPPPAGVKVSPTSGLVTSEAGGLAALAVALNSRPAGPVTIALASTDTSEGTVSPASVTFTAADWNVDQTVTVTGRDDLIADGDVAYQVVVAPAISDDPAYAGLDGDDVAVVNTDNDVAGVTVSPTGGLVTTEQGGAATFTVVLNTEPVADVTIALSSTDGTEGTVAPASLTFTAANWNVPQAATVTGVDDAVADGDAAFTIVTTASGADASYSGREVADVDVVNVDDDVAGITVSPTSLATSESGASAQFTLALTSQPTAEVTIRLSSSDPGEGTVSPEAITFTPANWNVAQTATVTGVDDAEVDGPVAFAIVVGPATSGDSMYDGRDAADVAVTNADDDAPPPCSPFTERLTGRLDPGQGYVDVPVLVRCKHLQAAMKAHPGNESVSLDLLDAEGRLVAAGDGHRRLNVNGLAPGRYVYRVSGSVSRPVDFVIKSEQGERKR